MSDRYLNKHDYYNIDQQPNENVNPNTTGVLWNANDSTQLKCCIDNTNNKNRWQRLNPDLYKFDDIITDVENKLEKPEFVPPINGYKSQIIARYLTIDGDDGNGTAVSFGNRQIRICPHWYHKWSGGDEYGSVSLMLRDIGYLGTVGRLVMDTYLDTVPRSITLSNGATLGLHHTGGWDYVFKVTGGELPLWPKSNSFAIGKLKFYFINPYKDPRSKPYCNFSREFCIRHDYKDLLTSIPFPYDRYHECTVKESNIPVTEIVGWKAVSIGEWNACLDPRKKVDTGSNTYLIPITFPDGKPYNARDEGISGYVNAWNGLAVSLVDVYYDGEIDEPVIKEPKCDLYPTKLCQYADTDYCIKYFKYDDTFRHCKHYYTPLRKSEWWV